jgi:hypothetical protein
MTPRSLRAISLPFHLAISRRAGSLNARLKALRRPSGGAPSAPRGGISRRKWPRTWARGSGLVLK